MPLWPLTLSQYIKVIRAHQEVIFFFYPDEVGGVDMGSTRQGGHQDGIP